MKISNRLSPEKILEQSQALQQAGKYEQAAVGFEKLKNLYPLYPPVLNSLGIVYLQLGRSKEGCKLLEKSLEIDPKQHIAFLNLGVALRSQNKLLEALNVFEKALKFFPSSFEIFNNLGITLHSLTRYHEAISIYQKAIKIKSEIPDAFNNLGISQLALRQFEDAISTFKEALKLNPNNPEIINNLGFSLFKLNKFQESIDCYTQAISLNKLYADAYSNRGLSYQAIHKTNEALLDYDECIKLNPNHANNYWNKSLLKLLIGDFDEGWSLYEWRWKSFAKTAVRYFSKPLWLGQTSIKNKTIIIYGEQGYGDYIQFLRYIPLLKNLDAEIILEVRPALVELISSTHPELKIIESGNQLQRFDYQCPIMSLPLALKNHLNTIPNSTPYISVDPEKIKEWADDLGKKTITRIGLVWSGSSEHQNDHNRSLSLEELSPILTLPFEFHSIQKEYRIHDLEILKQHPIKTHTEKLKNFSDTAALIDSLDLIISVDTSVAHLAGSLNKKVWIMLPSNPDWRWMLNRTDSPWYPSAKLFRQTTNGEWRDVVKKIAAELSATS